MVVVGWVFFSISDLASIFGEVSAFGSDDSRDADTDDQAEHFQQFLVFKLHIASLFKMIQNPLLTKTLSRGEGILLTGAFLQ